MVKPAGVSSEAAVGWGGHMRGAAKVCLAAIRETAFACRDLQVVASEADRPRGATLEELCRRLNKVLQSRVQQFVVIEPATAAGSAWSEDQCVGRWGQDLKGVREYTSYLAEQLSGLERS